MPFAMLVMFAVKNYATRNSLLLRSGSIDLKKKFFFSPVFALFLTFPIFFSNSVVLLFFAFKQILKRGNQRNLDKTCF